MRTYPVKKIIATVGLLMAFNAAAVVVVAPRPVVVRPRPVVPVVVAPRPVVVAPAPVVVAPAPVPAPVYHPVARTAAVVGTAAVRKNEVDNSREAISDRQHARQNAYGN